jgi:hypothetical protein
VGGELVADVMTGMGGAKETMQNVTIFTIWAGAWVEGHDWSSGTVINALCLQYD